MAVRVDKPGDYGLSAEVDLLGARRGQPADLVVRADGDKAPVGDRDGLGMRIRRVHRVDVPVEENQLGLGRCSPCENARGESSNKIAAFHGFTTLRYQRTKYQHDAS